MTWVPLRFLAALAIMASVGALVGSGDLLAIAIAGLAWVLLYWALDVVEMTFDPVLHRVTHSRRRCYREREERRRRSYRIRDLEEELGVEDRYPVGPVLGRGDP